MKAVTALFDSANDVRATLALVEQCGIPRDLLDVAVSREAAERHYKGKVDRRRTEIVRYAGTGGLVGLVIAAVLSGAMLAWPGTRVGGQVAVALLGPNVAVLVGALIGTLIGLLISPPLSESYARALEAGSPIVLIVRVRDEQEARRLADLLRNAGGRGIQTS